MHDGHVFHNNKRCIILGTKGLPGKWIVPHLYSAGASICLLNTEETEKDSLDEKATESHKIIPGEKESISEAVRTFTVQNNPIDYLICSTNFDQMRKELDVADPESETWNKLVDKWIMTYFHLLQETVPPMIEKGSGKIVFFNSTRGYTGEGEGEGHLSPEGSIFEAACSSAITGMMTSIARDIIPKGISINGIALGNSLEEKKNKVLWALDLWLSGMASYSCGQIYRIY